MDIMCDANVFARLSIFFVNQQEFFDVTGLVEKKTRATQKKSLCLPNKTRHRVHLPRVWTASKTSLSRQPDATS